MERKMVLPGDEIAVAEEFEPGEGTYEAKGLVFAATPGVLELDPANRVARVRAFNPPAELRVGDIVYGAVDDIRGMMATATIQAIHGRARQISGESEGTIHISNVSEEYTEDIHDMYRLGDIIRAKVIQVKPSVQLTTAEPSLGVVKALCSVCRGPLEMRGRDLYCPRDERSERRRPGSVSGPGWPRTRRTGPGTRWTGPRSRSTSVVRAENFVGIPFRELAPRIEGKGI